MKHLLIKVWFQIKILHRETRKIKNTTKKQKYHRSTSLLMTNLQKSKNQSKLKFQKKRRTNKFLMKLKKNNNPNLMKIKYLFMKIKYLFMKIKYLFMKIKYLFMKINRNQSSRMFRRRYLFLKVKSKEKSLNHSRTQFKCWRTSLNKIKMMMIMQSWDNYHKKVNPIILFLLGSHSRRKKKNKTHKGSIQYLLHL